MIQLFALKLSPLLLHTHYHWQHIDVLDSDVVDAHATLFSQE